MGFWRNQMAVGCESVVGEGKPNVVGCMARLEEEAIRGVLAVVDADYDVLTGAKAGANIVRTDAHDLECMLCRAPALDRVVVEYGTAEKVSGVDVRSELVERALVFGRVRWALVRLACDADEKAELPRVAPLLQEVVDREMWSVDRDRLLARIEERLGEDSGLSEAIAALPDADPWHVVHGHDMVELLRIGLLHALGDMRPKYRGTDIARALRLAMTKDDLRATAMAHRDSGVGRVESALCCVGWMRKLKPG